MNSENSTLRLNQVKPQKEPQNNDARKIVGVTGRLLNFLGPAWQAGKTGKEEFCDLGRVKLMILTSDIVKFS